MKFRVRFVATMASVALVSTPLNANPVKPTNQSEVSEVVRELFSFNRPDSYQFGSEQQKNTLKQIAKEEFSLQHLSDVDQLLVDEALRHSGVEVHKSCVIEKEAKATLGAFFRRHNQTEHKFFDPTLGVKDLAPEEGNGTSEPFWRHLYSDLAEYPYPFSEEQVLPKVIPINMSSVKNTGRSDTSVSFSAKPSRLLTAGLSDQDRIISEEDLIVDFDINPETKRITQLNVHLKKPLRVYFGIKIRIFEAKYEFDHDSIADRNVLKRLHHSLKGRLWLAFNPNLNVETSLTYTECNSEVTDRSFLAESMEAIRQLE